jgi:hypothetical protein
MGSHAKRGNCNSLHILVTEACITGVTCTRQIGRLARLSGRPCETGCSRGERVPTAAVLFPAHYKLGDRL